MNTKKYISDYLVIGSGIAGLSFAIKASAGGTVNLVTKKKESDSNTNYAQGGIAAVLAPDDSFRSHFDDTMNAGGGLCKREALEVMVKNGPERIKELINWGTRFSHKNETDESSELDLGKEGGHTHKRVAHAMDLTGKEIETALLNMISGIDNIKIFEDHTAVDLLTEHQLRAKTDSGINCYGAYILDNLTGEVHTFNSRITLLATGGAGQVYLHTTNPDIATGDGIAMAYRAGALIGDMEFIQFHPTSLYTKKKVGRSFLISEAVRGEGGILINSRGDKIMEKVHPMKDLAPRDIVARTIDSELKKTGDDCVFLDITSKKKEFLQKRFPAIYNYCLKQGIDISAEPIPVVPAAHYLCGGVITDINGRTNIRNLYVSGECACTGVHGANRLASNSLLEGVVFSHRSFLESSKYLEKNRNEIKIPGYPHWSKEGTFDLKEWILVNHNIDDVKRLMWDYVGIVRSDMRLEKAYRRILMLAEEIHDYYRKSTISSKIVELRNLATVAKLIIKCAMTRKDSIGLHYNIDHIKRGESLTNVVLRSGSDPSLIDASQR